MSWRRNSSKGAPCIVQRGHRPEESRAAKRAPSDPPAAADCAELRQCELIRSVIEMLSGSLLSRLYGHGCGAGRGLAYAIIHAQVEGVSSGSSACGVPANVRPNAADLAARGRPDVV